MCHIMESTHNKFIGPVNKYYSHDLKWTTTIYFFIVLYANENNMTGKKGAQLSGGMFFVRHKPGRKR